jgi:hypothetical protein
MNTKKENIRYNYYAIDCLNIVNSINDTNSLKNISASFRGRVNNPNIIYTKNNLKTNYQATDIYVNGKNHNIKNVIHDGEIVILHRPTTTSVKLYTCFPYVSSNTITDIDNLIDSESHSLSKIYQDEPFSIEMNKYIEHNPQIREYETTDTLGEKCIVIVFEHVIKIKHHMNGKMLEKGLFNVILEKPDVSMVEDKLKTPSILMEGFHEGIKNQEDAMKKLSETVGVSDTDVIYKCEYLPVDTKDMVQVLQVPIGSPGYGKEVGNEISGIFVSNTIFIFGVLVVFFVSPLFYGLIESLVRSDTFLKNIPFMKKNLNMSVNLLNLLLVLIISGITIILLIHGLVSSDGTAIAISIFIPFCALISYVGITFFRNSTTENSEQFVIPPRNPILRGEEHKL